MEEKLVKMNLRHVPFGRLFEALPYWLRTDETCEEFIARMQEEKEWDPYEVLEVTCDDADEFGMAGFWQQYAGGLKPGAQPWFQIFGLDMFHVRDTLNGGKFEGGYSWKKEEIDQLFADGELVQLPGFGTFVQDAGKTIAEAPLAKAVIDPSAERDHAHKPAPVAGRTPFDPFGPGWDVLYGCDIRNIPKHQGSGLFGRSTNLEPRGFGKL